MYAVIKTGGKQYRVAKDELLEIERHRRGYDSRMPLRAAFSDVGPEAAWLAADRTAR